MEPKIPISIIKSNFSVAFAKLWRFINGKQKNLFQLTFEMAMRSIKVVSSSPSILFPLIIETFELKSMLPEEKIFRIIEEKVEKKRILDAFSLIEGFDVCGDEKVKKQIIQKIIFGKELNGNKIGKIIRKTEASFQKETILKIFARQDKSEAQKAIEIIDTLGMSINEFPNILEYLTNR